MSTLVQKVPKEARNGLTVRVTEHVDKKEWDRWVSSVTEGSYRQTAMFADHQTRRVHEKVLYFEALDGTGQVAGQLMARVGAPLAWGIRRRPLAGLFLPLLGALLPCMAWGDGPVITTTRRRKEVYEAILRRAVEEARRRGCFRLDGWPAFYGDRHATERDWIRGLYNACGFQMATNATLIVDLRKDEDELWLALRREARTKIRKAQKQGVEIVELVDDEHLVGQAHLIVQETAARNNVACLSLTEMVQSLRYHRSHGVFRAFIAKHEGRGVAYQAVTCYNRSAILGGVSYSDYGRAARIPGNDLLQWHVMKTVREMGIDWLDYGGVYPDSKDPKMRGIYKFKSKWGGQKVNYDQFHRAVSGVRWPLVGTLADRLFERIVCSR